MRVTIHSSPRRSTSSVTEAHTPDVTFSLHRKCAPAHRAASTPRPFRCSSAMAINSGGPTCSQGMGGIMAQRVTRHPTAYHPPMHSEPFVVAVVQATPVYIDRAATVAKACGIIREAAARNARLVVFPEAFVPCYPFWIWHIAAGETRALRELYVELLDNAVRVPGPETEALCLAARESGVAVAIGVNEINSEGSGTTLYNSLLYIDGEGRIAGCHRKLIPTSGERLVHW